MANNDPTLRDPDLIRLAFEVADTLMAQRDQGPGTTFKEEDELRRANDSALAAYRAAKGKVK